MVISYRMTLLCYNDEKTNETLSKFVGAKDKTIRYGAGGKYISRASQVVVWCVKDIQRNTSSQGVT